MTSGTAFRFASLLTLLVIVIAGAAQSLVASDDFHSTWDGIWWAIEMETTVGYGDAYPTSVFGIGFLSVLTAAVASRFVKTERGDETEAILAALMRLEAEIAALKEHVAPTLGRESGTDR